MEWEGEQLACCADLGVEVDLMEGFALGVEARYVHETLDDDEQRTSMRVRGMDTSILLRYTLGH